MWIKLIFLEIGPKWNTCLLWALFEVGKGQKIWAPEAIICTHLKVNLIGRWTEFCGPRLKIFWENDKRTLQNPNFELCLITTSDNADYMCNLSVGKAKYEVFKILVHKIWRTSMHESVLFLLLVHSIVVIVILWSFWYAFSCYKFAFGFDVSDKSLQWRHNECDAVSNHHRLDCLLNHLFKRRWKKTSQLHIAGLYKGNPLVTGGFPSQMPSKEENASLPFDDVFISYIWK